MKVALVHDDFVQSGGAESLFATIASLWPEAPIFTSLVNWNKLPVSIDKNRVRPSFMQKIPLATKLYKAFLPLYPFAFESFNFDDFDVVISSTTRFAKSIITKPSTIHICYTNSISRFLWEDSAQKNYLPMPARIFTKPIFLWLKRWDKVSGQRVDFYIANSQNVKEKIEKFYKSKSEIIYPFADLNFFKRAKIHNWNLKSQNYFLVVTRLVKWKKVDIAIEAALSLGFNLKIVGSGPDEKRLKRLVAVNSQPSTVNSIEFLGQVSKGQLKELYQNCQALIITQEEDFGIAQVEAQACGIPVVAYRAGGQKEIIIDGQTGILFKEQSAQSLKDAISTFLGLKLDMSASRKNSLRFSKAVFVKSLKNKINLYAPKS